MKLRRLGKTELQVSEIGFGGEWLERHPEEDSIDLIHYASAQGINILDCWMPDPKSRDIIGKGIKDNRRQWYIQGHIGSTWKDEQYFRTRDMKYVRPAFEDLLRRLQTDYIDLGMIHYVDSEKEWEQMQHSDYLGYVTELKNSGVALVERDFPQRAGSGSGERCVCCFKGFRRTTVCSAPARRAKFSRWRQTLICCPRARILTRCLRKHLTRDSRERTQTARSYTASVKKMTSASQS